MVSLPSSALTCTRGLFRDVAEQDAQAQRDGEQLFDDAAQGTRALRLAEAFFAQQVDGAVVGMQRQALFQQARWPVRSFAGA